MALIIGLFFPLGFPQMALNNSLQDEGLQDKRRDSLQDDNLQDKGRDGLQDDIL